MKRAVRTLLLLGLAAIAVAQSDSAKPEAKPTPGVLAAADAHRLIPPSFFYAGQTAPVQSRNSGAYRSANGKLMLAALVDNSGYSSAIAEKYQGFIATDGKIKIGGKELSPGAYGIGALADGSFVVTDLGANTLFSVTFENDAELKRPVPLKFVQQGTSVRLYLGRRFVTVETATEGQ